METAIYTQIRSNSTSLELLFLIFYHAISSELLNVIKILPFFLILCDYSERQRQSKLLRPASRKIGNESKREELALFFYQIVLVSYLHDGKEKKIVSPCELLIRAISSHSAF